MAAPLEFYFDFSSPYSYLAHVRLPEIARRTGRALVYCPVDLAEIKRAAGNIGPAARDLPAKQRYVRQDTLRWAARYGVPLAEPAGRTAPLLNRGVFFAMARDRAREYVDAVYRRIWGEGNTMDAPAVLDETARELGWDAAELQQYVVSEAAESQARALIKQARGQAVFGVPTVVADGRLWWGNDRLFLVAAYLENGCPPAAAPACVGAPEHNHG